MEPAAERPRGTGIGTANGGSLAGNPTGDPGERSAGPVAAAVAALDRAAYCLERVLAPTAKVAAFRRAGAVTAELHDEELTRRVRAGTLTELVGIGPSTGGVIAAAVNGEPSPYLDRLESDTRLPVGDGAELRATLRGDCHAHSTWSDGGAELEEMAAAAAALGHEWLVVTDHSPRMSVARGLTPERVEAQRREIDRLNADLSPFRLLAGMEVDINEDGTLDAPPEVLAGLEVVVASPHLKLGMDPAAMTRRLVRAVSDPNVDVLGHCTGRKVGWGGARKRPAASFDADVVFAACARFGVAVEINCRPERQDPPSELLDVALAWGCDVAINTDAHARGQLEWQVYGCDKAARAGVDPRAVLNAHPAEELLARLAGRSPGADRSG